ncbi:carbohydrate porin [Reichenbachiella carrageenanivorans]|uniref:Carbohydrate porin n=1 Tax=Reichenbachiella carrageenanivorans TaxID=2979869 RepID=A0ABY6D1V9_9BACT|nr:carbohydrate porin [Reichenbachiella carrageenanivorans]UXX80121.1 carbohydrate porin [Reichenbachiella carrageenanivorans]
MALRIQIKYLLILLLLSVEANAQIAYQNVSNRNVALGSYGRVGVDWSLENNGTIGRRLNLNNMGSIGGRMEEQDYLELAPALHFQPAEDDSTTIYAQMRFAVYANSQTSFGNSTTSSIGGLTIAIPEMYVEARNINGKPLSMWIGARLYRGPDVHIADHFYFNDHSSQGFGLEWKGTRMMALFVESTDTTSTVPPYFYLNIKTGTASASLRQRIVMAVEQDVTLSSNDAITFLGEFHRMANADERRDTITVSNAVNFPADVGIVIGAKYQRNLPSLLEGSFNHLAIRYGTGIANGGDGGLSRTWLTFGAPDLNNLHFGGAYSLYLVNHTVLNFSQNYTLNAYAIYTKSKGAADSDHMAKSYFGKEVFNRKEDFTIGSRNEFYMTNYFHLLVELHYSQRRDGTNPIASTTKFSIAPVFVPTGKRDTWARPHLRFVASIARYNDFAMKSLYSPYLQFAGEHRWGYYFGVKAEWWIFN